MTRLKKQITHRGSPKACAFTYAHAHDTHKVFTELTLAHIL